MLVDFLISDLGKLVEIGAVAVLSRCLTSLVSVITKDTQTPLPHDTDMITPIYLLDTRAILCSYPGDTRGV